MGGAASVSIPESVETNAAIFDRLREEFQRHLDEVGDAPTAEDKARIVVAMQREFEFISSDVAQREETGRVVLFGITGCRHCRAAKALLQEKGHPFVYISLDDYPAFRALVKEKSGRTTVPQIWFNERHVGGNEELQALNEAGELDAAVAAVLSEPLHEDAPPLPGDLEDAAQRRQEQQEASDEESKFSRVEDMSGTDEAAADGDSLEEGKQPHADLVVRMRHPETGVEIKKRRYHLRTYRDCFTGKGFVDWLVANESMTREEAVAVGRDLLARQRIHHVCYSEQFEDFNFFYRWQENSSSTCLNLQQIFDGVPRRAAEVSAELRRMVLVIYDEFLSPDGQFVDYEGIAASTAWVDYQRASTELQRVDLGDLTRDESLAFFINVYNALVIHGTVAVGTPKNAWQRSRFFNAIAYNIGGLEYSLNDIENGVLRGNRKPPYALSFRFGANDPRRFHILSPPEPRIHFALVCGARSCPPIKLYSAENVQEALTMAAESFLEDDAQLRVSMEDRVVNLSMILKWYAVDFGDDDAAVLRTLAQWLSGDKKDQVEQLAAEGNFSLRYYPYDWGVNKKD